MTYNQITRTFSTPAKKRIAIGAATVMTAGALLGVGVAGASASTASSAVSHSSSSSGDAVNARSIVHQVRAAFFFDSLDGAEAQKLATAATEQALVFPKLPTALQTDLTSLKDASATERDASAEKISATSLDGGYGDELKTIATDLKSGAKLPLGEIIRDAIADLSLGKTLGQADLPTAPTSHVGADADVSTGK